MVAKSVERLLKNLNALLEAQGITQLELSKRARVPQTTVNRVFHLLENGVSPRLDTLEGIARGLKVTVVDLLGADSNVIAVASMDSPRVVSRQLGRLTEDFLVCDFEARKEILQLAEDRANRSAAKEK